MPPNNETGLSTYRPETLLSAESLRARFPERVVDVDGVFAYAGDDVEASKWLNLLERSLEVDDILSLDDAEADDSDGEDDDEDELGDLEDFNEVISSISLRDKARFCAYALMQLPAHLMRQNRRYQAIVGAGVFFMGSATNEVLRTAAGEDMLDGRSQAVTLFLGGMLLIGIAEKKLSNS